MAVYSTSRQLSSCCAGSPVSVPIGQQDPQTPCTMPQHHLHPKMPQHTPKRAVEQGTARRKPGRPRRHEAAPAQRPNGAYTEAQYRAHMNERKDSMARLGSVFIQESMVSICTPILHSHNQVPVRLLLCLLVRFSQGLRA